MNTIKIQNEPSFVRDNYSKAILNTNNEELKAYKKRKHNTTSIQKEICTLKKEVQDLKMLLSNLISKEG